MLLTKQEWQVKDLNAGFGAIIDDIAVGELSGKECDELKSILYDKKILILRNQKPSPEAYIAFAKKMGKIQEFVDKSYYHPDHPEIFVVSNIKKDGKQFGMNRVGYYWHQDSTFTDMPLPITMLLAKIPSELGGETGFIDTEHAFNTLSEADKKLIENRYAVHEGFGRFIITEKEIGKSIIELQEEDYKHVPPVKHPVVISHPFNKRKSLYVNEGFTSKIEGLEDDVLKRLKEAISSSEKRYIHKWSENDLVIWDNRSVVHRAFKPEGDSKRLMFRIGVYDGPVY